MRSDEVRVPTQNVVGQSNGKVCRPDPIIIEIHLKHNETTGSISLAHAESVLPKKPTIQSIDDTYRETSSSSRNTGSKSSEVSSSLEATKGSTRSSPINSPKSSKEPSSRVTSSFKSCSKELDSREKTKSGRVPPSCETYKAPQEYDDFEYKSNQSHSQANYYQPNRSKPFNSNERSRYCDEAKMSTSYRSDDYRNDCDAEIGHKYQNDCDIKTMHPNNGIQRTFEEQSDGGVDQRNGPRQSPANEGSGGRLGPKLSTGKRSNRTPRKKYKSPRHDPCEGVVVQNVSLPLSKSGRTTDTKSVVAGIDETGKSGKTGKIGKAGTAHGRKGFGSNDTMSGAADKASAEFAQKAAETAITETANGWGRPNAGRKMCSTIRMPTKNSLLLMLDRLHIRGCCLHTPQQYIYDRVWSKNSFVDPETLPMASVYETAISLNCRAVSWIFRRGSEALRMTLVQALRWRITRSSQKYRAKFVEAFDKCDLFELRCAQPDRTMLHDLLWSPNTIQPSKLTDATARLVNAIASTPEGRAYMAPYSVVPTLIWGREPLRGMPTHRTNRYNLSASTVDNLIAAIMKLSLVEYQRVDMLHYGMTNWLITHMADIELGCSTYHLKCTTLSLLLLLTHAPTLREVNCEWFLILCHYIAHRSDACRANVRAIILALLQNPWNVAVANGMRMDMLIVWLLKRCKARSDEHQEFMAILSELKTPHPGLTIPCRISAAIKVHDKAEFLDSYIEFNDPVKSDISGEAFMELKCNFCLPAEDENDGQNDDTNNNVGDDQTTRYDCEEESENRPNKERYENYDNCPILDNEEYGREQQDDEFEEEEFDEIEDEEDNENNIVDPEFECRIRMIKEMERVCTGSGSLLMRDNPINETTFNEWSAPGANHAGGLRKPNEYPQQSAEMGKSQPGTNSHSPSQKPCRKTFQVGSSCYELSQKESDDKKQRKPTERV